MRKEEMENLVTTGYVEGKRPRGRQRETYLTHLQKMKEKTPIELIHLTRDRGVWSELSNSSLRQHDMGHPGKVSVETSDGSYVRNRVHLRKSNEDPPDTPVLPTRTVEPTLKTTSPSTSRHSTEQEHCIPTHSTPQYEAQSPCASEMRTDTRQTPTRSDTGYTTRFGRQVKPPSRYL